MLTHLRANLWLLLFTLILCSVLYPLILWGIGQTVFSRQAEGSLVENKGKTVGSRLIAQPFRGDEYFQPRPSAVSYNAAASGGSNLGATNYLLRDRVARTLGPMVKYQDAPPNGNSVQDDILAWFKTQPNIVADWATAHSGVAQAWVNADDKHKEVVTEWMKKNPSAVEAWKKDNTDGEPKPADLAVAFFQDNAKVFHDSWPKLVDDSSWSIPAVFFDAWLQAHPNVTLQEVPADMVMTSGSGLDPHITVKNARYQLDRVVSACAKKFKLPEAKVKGEIEILLNDLAESPLGGLAGVPLVNVLELNLAVQARLGSIP